MDDFFDSVLFVPSSDATLLIRFGETLPAETDTRVTDLAGILLSKKLNSVLNIHPAYNSVLLAFNPALTDHARLEQEVRIVASEKHREPKRVHDVVSIPVCYGDEFGPDLDHVSSHCGLSTEEVIALHASAEYRVSFLGFTPGFPYLGGMPIKLSVPRLPVPRKHIPAGSVAIGGEQTGIYPLDSPGGWRIIGRTPLRMFNQDVDPPALLGIGNRVRFLRISKHQFESTNRNQ